MVLQNELQILVEDDLLVEENIIGGSINSMKTALMKTIDKLSDTIDFLQNELEERNLHIRTLLLRDANEGRSIDIELFNKTPNLSLMETIPSDIHENNFSDKNISKHASKFNNTNEMLISEQDTAVVKGINDDASIYSGNSSISLDSTIIDDSCDSSNDESNYSIKTSFMMVDNYDTNEHQNANSTDMMQSSGRKSLETITPINYCNYDYNDNNINQKHLNNTVNNWNNTVNNWKISDENANIDLMNVYQSNIDERGLWNNRTTLIVGDSMLYGLDCKGRIYPGASIEDMHYNLVPLLRKKPATIILHTGTNNSTHNTSSEIIEKLVHLKEFILLQLPECKVIFSSLINRFDDAKAQLTTEVTNKRFKKLGHHVIDNSNINREHLGKKGHHKTPYGTSRLALNFIRILKKL